MSYSIDQKTIVLPNGSSFDFEHPIKDILVIENIIIILIDPPFKVNYNQNVFAITSSGDFLWRINSVELYYTRSENCPYVAIQINKEDELVLFNWCDTAVIVSPLTGDVIKKYPTK
jgi:hypothetical protein